MNGLCHSFHEHNHKKSELEDGIVILSIVVQDDLKTMIHSSIRFLSDVGLITEQEYQSVYLLSRCGYLTVTKRSSFGDTAVILSSANAVFQISCHVC